MNNSPSANEEKDKVQVETEKDDQSATQQAEEENSKENIVKASDLSASGNDHSQAEGQVAPEHTE